MIIFAGLAVEKAVGLISARWEKKKE